MIKDFCQVVQFVTQQLYGGHFSFLGTVFFATFEKILLVIDKWYALDQTLYKLLK